MMRRGREAGSRRRDESPWHAALMVLAATIVCGGLLVAPFVYVAAHLGGTTHGGGATERLTAIPVSAAACPAVRSIQSAAQDFENAWMAADESTAPWPVPRAKLESSLQGLQRTLTKDARQLPPPVRARLVRVLANVRNGRAVVASSAGFGDVVHNGYRALNAAYSSYGDAATLVGNACGSLSVSRTTTTPSRR